MIDFDWLVADEPVNWKALCTASEENMLAEQDLRAAEDIVRETRVTRTLHIHGLHHLRDLKCELGALDLCREIDVSMNFKLRSIDSSVSFLFRLEKVHLNYCAFETFPECLCTLQFVRVVSLAGNGLRHLPASIGGMKRLECLNLDNNRLKSVPACILRGPVTQLLLSNNPLAVKGEAVDTDTLLPDEAHPAVCDHCATPLLYVVARPRVRITFHPFCSIPSLPCHHVVHPTDACSEFLL